MLVIDSVGSRNLGGRKLNLMALWGGIFHFTSKIGVFG